MDPKESETSQQATQAGTEAQGELALQDIALETTDLVNLVVDKLLTWVEGFISMLPNLAVAFLVLIFFAIASRYVGRFAASGLKRAHANAQLVSLGESTTRYAILGLGFFIALDILALEKAVTSMLAGIGVVGLALGFAFQDIASNFMSGVIMAVRRPFELGDLVETGGTMGTIERVTLRATIIRNFSGQTVIIPNKNVLQNPIINYSQTGHRRIELPVGVAYGSDLDQVRKVAIDAADGMTGLDSDEEIGVVFTGFGGSSIDLEVHAWLDLHADKTNFIKARSELIQRINRAFGEAGIEIPFPIRTLDIPSDAGLSVEMREAS